MENNMPQCSLVCVKLFCVNLYSLYIVFCVPLENISVIQGRHHNRRRAAKFRFLVGPYNDGLGVGEGILSCPTYSERRPRFTRSHLKDRPLKSPLKVCLGYCCPIVARILTGFPYRRNKGRCQIVNFELHCNWLDVNTKFTIWQLIILLILIYSHPINSKFTMWHFKVAHNSGIKFLKSKRIVFDNER